MASWYTTNSKLKLKILLIKKQKFYFT